MGLALGNQTCAVLTGDLRRAYGRVVDRTERRRKRLLGLGELRFACVLDSDAGSSALLPGIRYSFQTTDGKKIEGFN